MSAPKVRIAKYGGDDKYSWAVFREDRPLPVYTGCSLADARYYRDKVRAQLQSGETAR